LHRIKKNHTGNRPKSEKKRENMQVHFCQMRPFRLFNPSPNGATNAFDLFAHPAYSTPTALDGIAAVILSVGRFGVIVEQQLQ
jgi:hypothetical protein